jgi:hypothetical protein
MKATRNLMRNAPLSAKLMKASRKPFQAIDQRSERTPPSERVIQIFQLAEFPLLA